MIEIGGDSAGESSVSGSTGESRNDDLSHSFNCTVISSPKLSVAGKGVKHISLPERQQPGTPEPFDELHMCLLLKKSCR